MCSGLERSTRRALQMPVDETQARARAYRDAMRTQRNASVLNEELNAFLASAFAV